VIFVGLFITLLGALGTYFTQQRFWFKSLMLNVANFIIFVALVVVAIVSIIFAFEIKDPVKEGIEETWYGPGGMHSKLEPEGFCEPDISAELVASEGLAAVTEVDDCKLFYQWAQDVRTLDDDERCEKLGLVPNATCPEDRCNRKPSAMALDCSLTWKPQPGPVGTILSACDPGPDRMANNMCEACAADCMKLAIKTGQDSVGILPFVCYFVFFFMVLSLMFNIYMMECVAPSRANLSVL
jgi:hypothetical protein